MLLLHQQRRLIRERDHHHAVLSLRVPLPPPEPVLLAHANEDELAGARKRNRVHKPRDRDLPHLLDLRVLLLALPQPHEPVARARRDEVRVRQRGHGGDPVGVPVGILAVRDALHRARLLLHELPEADPAVLPAATEELLARHRDGIDGRRVPAEDQLRLLYDFPLPHAPVAPRRHAPLFPQRGQACDLALVPEQRLDVAHLVQVPHLDRAVVRP
eukprot:3776402-Rhodomonas_salina.1